MSLQLPHTDAPNLAPLDSLKQNIERKAQDNSILVEPDWFKKIKGELEGEDKATWDDETLKWALVFNFIEGRHLLKRAKYGKGWRSAPLPERTDIPVYGFNLTGFYSESIKAKWTQSSTDIRWRPSRETDDAIGATKAGQTAHDHYKRRLYTQAFKQMESLLAQCGKYARYYYYTDEVKSYARRPITGTEQVQFGEPSYFCADCGSSGTLANSGYGGSAQPANGGALSHPVPGGLGDMAATEGAPILNGGNAAISSPQGGLNGQTQNQASAPAGIRTLPGPDAGAMADNTSASPLGVPSRANTGSALAPDAGGIGAAGQVNPNMYPNPVGTDQGMVCPDCGSPNIDIEQAEPLEVETVQGYEDIERGDIVCEPVPAFELKHDLSERPQDSPYLIRRRRIRVPILQAKFPDLHIVDGKSDNRGVQIEESLKRTSGANSGSVWSKDSGEEKAADFIQIWLDPCMYSRIQLKSDMQTLGGMTIPAGTKLAELFPTGMYLCFIEGIDGVVELRDEHHKDYWVGESYRQRAVSSLGMGIEDIVEGNRQYDLVMSIIYTQLRTAAMPATLFDERLLPNGVSGYLGSLSNIPVQLSSLDDKRLQDAVYQLQPQPPTQAHFGYTDKLNNYMQMASRVTEFSGGLPGVDNTTATGAEITQATAQSLFGPQLALKAEVDRRGAEIILELFKKYCIDEVWVSISGKRGQMDGMWLKSADIGVDMFAEVVEDSYLPQTNHERRERWDAFLQRVGGLPGLKLALSEFPEQVEQLAEIFDVDLASADYTAAAEMCRLRIEQMSQAIPMLQVGMSQMPPVQMAQDPMSGEMGMVPVDPMAEAGQFLLGILQPPIELEEVGHMASIAYCRSWLTEDEGRDAPPELRAGVKAMIYQHLQGLLAEAQFTGMVAMAGQPPAPAGQEGGEKPNERKNKTPDTKQMQPGGMRQQQPQGATV